MARGKKIGVFLILAGLCIPMLSMLFASGYNLRQGFLWNVKYNEIVLWKKTAIVEKSISDNPYMDLVKDEKPQPPPGFVLETKPAYDPLKINEEPTKTKIYVPVSLFFGLGIILTAIGIGLVVISENVQEKAPL